ncbi:MAG: hypothetical protein ACREA4_12320 [Nitrososphaera sp.]
MMSALGNFVQLIPRVPKRLRFSQLYFEDRDVKDSVSGVSKQARVLVGVVISEDGLPVQKMFSTLSNQVARVLSAYMADPTLPQRVFAISYEGDGFKREYGVTVS